MGSAGPNEPGDLPHPYDPTFTDRVIAATGPKANARLAEIMPSLVRHLHDFARESNLTVAEWIAGVEFINECGRMSTDKRNETQLLCDILGLESLVDEITAKLLVGAAASTTPSAILGPFYRQGAPSLPNGSSIVRGLSPSLPWYERALEDATFIHGRDSTKAMLPLAGATIDVWHTAPNGLYEQQDDAQPDMNLRGRFTTDELGRFSFYCLRPVAYAIPDDGPAGRLLGMLDRGPFRPAHIHFLVEAEGHKTLVTQVFDAEDRWVGDDSVFAVKEELVVRYERREGDERARWGLEYDFVLARDGGEA
ncbi:aromatic compound dioxygenase [Coniochaeta ligniaria NRRL 30616]|uniref:Aromatic compound dioxygenase n=1 Tax=Coniochaeta ligniaria NRRL 30616 TaxID=1408157 RepID=A0A1J7JJ97_9PEZI|nr:aromatic compound dioxygenase [Coniochaeta ligniaria NRRL 30616]